MKLLILVRHAEAAPGPASLSDIDRPLQPLGRRDALAMARHLSDLEVYPEAIISSPAVRALSTAAAFETQFSVPVESVDEIYEANTKTLLEIIQQQDPHKKTVMLVGHNPGITVLLSVLTGKPYLPVPTGAVAVLMFPGSSWRNIRPGKGWFHTGFSPRSGPLRVEPRREIPLTRIDRFRIWWFRKFRQPLKDV